MDNQNYNSENNNETNQVNENTYNWQPNSDTSQQNRYEQPGFTFYNGNSYQQNGAAQFQNNNQYQGNTGYQNYTPYEEPRRQKPKREKKPRNKNGFGGKLVKCAAMALVFGLVAGGVMVGVQYAATPLLEKKNEESISDQPPAIESDNDKITSTVVSQTPVAWDVSDIVDDVMPSIVAITNISETEMRSFWGSQTYESTSAGSGIIVSSDNDYLYIATNNHVIDGAKTLTVTFSDEATVSAEVKGADPSIDLAVVKVALNSIEDDTMQTIKMATLGDSEQLRVGEASIAIGNALGYGQSVTTGCISALNRVVTVADAYSSISYTAELIQTDAAINPGNSGGALLNSHGEVIGINSVKYADTGVEGIGYAIPMSTAAPIINELITKEKVDESKSAYLGISGLDVTSELIEGVEIPNGVYVVTVFENTAAANYGILPGDIIVKFDEKEIVSMDSLTSTLQYYEAGSSVKITVMRSNKGQYQEQVLDVVLGKKN